MPILSSGNMPGYAQNAIMGQGQKSPFGNYSFANAGTQFLGGLFGNSDAPYREYGREYEKYNNQAQGFQNPFYNAGVGAIGNYQDALGKMKDPTAFINGLMNNYQESPWAKFQQDQMQRANTNMASASGLIGSTPYQQAGLQYARDISSEDMNGWLQNVLGANNNYLGGQQNLINSGQNSANMLSQLLEQMAQNKGQAAYGEEAGNNQDFSNTIGGLMGMFFT
jgi:hypothetical protein